MRNCYFVCVASQHPQLSLILFAQNTDSRRKYSHLLPMGQRILIYVQYFYIKSNKSMQWVLKMGSSHIPLLCCAAQGVPLPCMVDHLSLTLMQQARHWCAWWKMFTRRSGNIQYISTEQPVSTSTETTAHPTSHRTIWLHYYLVQHTCTPDN